MASYRYGKAVAEVVSANGTRRFLLRGPQGFFFRVYQADGEFTDYDIRHDDLEVTIAPDAMASFYCIGQDLILDHSPEVLGLKKIENFNLEATDHDPSKTT